MVRSGRQTVSVNVDGGVLHFDKKPGSFGAERVSHDRSATRTLSPPRLRFDGVNVPTRPEPSPLSHSSPADRQVPEQPRQGAHGGGRQPQRAVGDDLRERAGRPRLPCRLKQAYFPSRGGSPGGFGVFQKRDAFCKLLQLMRARHSQPSEPDMISVFVGTWNMGRAASAVPITRAPEPAAFNPSSRMYRPLSTTPTGGSPPPRSLQTWVTCCGLGHTPDESTAFLPHDIYALGTQENPQGEKEWTEHIKATLRSHTHIDFKLVSLIFLFPCKPVGTVGSLGASLDTWNSEV